MQLFSRVSGQGEAALIILHGLLGSSANWQTLAKRFGQSRTVYTLDMRNHGRSPWSNTMDYAAMAQDVFAFIEPLSHTRITVLGHSMGGKAAMQFALGYPDSLDALIVADIAPVSYEHDFDQLLGAMMAVDLKSIKNRAQADHALEKAIKNATLSQTNTSDGLDSIDPRIRAFLLHNLTFDKATDQWAWRPNLKVLLDKMDNITSFQINENMRYSGPTLFVHGAQSSYVQAKHEPVIRQYFPQASLSEIKHAGHWLHAEQAQAFYDTCENFLSYTH